MKTNALEYLSIVFLNKQKVFLHFCKKNKKKMLLLRQKNKDALFQNLTFHSSGVNPTNEILSQKSLK
jgi:hypothetical protein